MPIVRVGSQLLYFAHVPKCAGTSVETYVEDRFGAIAMVDHDHIAQPEGRRWSRTSPQHLDSAALARLFPAGFFDEVFAVVRHPVARLASVYRFHRDVTRLVQEGTSFEVWIRGLDEELAADPYAYDNHARPMVELVPDDAVVFRLEDGLEPLVAWFDEVEGAQRGPRRFPRLNTGRGDGLAGVGEHEVALIAERYAADFDRFGYAPDAPAPARPVKEAPSPLTQRLRRALRGER